MIQLALIGLTCNAPWPEQAVSYDRFSTALWIIFIDNLLTLNFSL